LPKLPSVSGADGFIGRYVQGIVIKGDIRTLKRVDGTVIHLAALKDVQESYRSPLGYWDVNVAGTLNLLRAMTGDKIVFASSAAVHGTSPYGNTKRACEDLIRDSGKRYAILRIHNPVGPGCSGLFKFLQAGRVVINGDGSAVRDYFSVIDCAEVIMQAARDLENGCESFTCDVGSGVGTSTLQAAKMMGADITYGPAVNEQSESVAKNIRYRCRPLAEFLGEL
jgi:UDP-glucose 4-epimerase